MTLEPDPDYLRCEPTPSAHPPLRVLVVDDHTILRAGLRALLELELGIEIVGEAANVEDALRLAEQHRPNLALTDIGLPGRSGLTLVTELRSRLPGCRILLLTAHSSKEYIRAGLDSMADGYVLKDSTHKELITAIRQVARGEQFLCKAVADIVLATYLNRAPNGSAAAPTQSITTRERQVLTRIASGQTNKSVARELSLSVKTVEKHRANLMRKLLLHNAADITRFAINHHLIARESLAAPLGV